MDQPITPTELQNNNISSTTPSGSFQSQQLDISTNTQAQDSRHGALSPVLPQRIPPKKGRKSHGSKNMLGSSSRGMGVLREAASTKNHVARLDEESKGDVNASGVRAETGAPDGSISATAAAAATTGTTTAQHDTPAISGASGTTMTKSEGLLSSNASLDNISNHSQNVTPRRTVPSSRNTSPPQTPKTYITKPNGDTQELQTHPIVSDTESVSSRRSQKAKKASKSKGKVSAKKKSPKKLAKTKSAKNIKGVTSKHHRDVQTEFQATHTETQTKIDADMMKEIMMGVSGTPLSGLPQPINTTLQRNAGSNVESPSGLSSPGSSLLPSSGGFQSMRTSHFQKSSDAFSESVEDILEQLVDMYSEVTPDLRHKSEFRSLVLSVVNQIRMKEKRATEKVNNWKSRYEKLQIQWRKVMSDFDSLFKEKENLRKERDSLLCSQQDDFSKRALLQGVSLADNKLLRDFFVTDMQQAVSGIKESLNATFALMWVFNQDTNELQTISVAPQPSDEDPETLQKVQKEANFSIPCTKDLIGECFQTSEPVNLLYAHKEEQHNHLADILLNIHTKTMLCFPLISPRTQTAIGVLQVINKTLLYTKKSMVRFTVDDEEKMNQYAYILGRVLDSARDLYTFGRGSRKQNVTSTPRRVGRPLSGGREERIEFLKFHGGLLPAHVKTYISDLYNKQIELSTLYEQARSEVKQLTHENRNKDESIQNLKFNQFIFVEDPKKKTKKEELFKSISDLEKVVKSKKKDVEKIDVNALRTDVQKVSKAKQKATKVAAAHDGKKKRALKRASQSQFVDNSKKKKTIMALEKQLEELEESTDDEQDNSFFNANEHVATSSSTSAQQDNADDQKKVTRFITKKQKKLIEDQKRRRHRTVYSDIYVDMFSEHPIPLMLLSKYFQVVHVNRSLCKALECNQDFLIGKLFSTLATKVSHSNLAQVFQNDIVNDVRIRIGMDDFIIDDEDDRHTRIYQLLIRELGFVDTKFKLINNKVPLEGPLFLVCLIE
mmetsp:Transcript_7217/g.27020  ORF Transcript_7217/g.27020 Transcript_7217/m.27020 type:complete len:1005 (-) Transcript_7217:2178-5192(-)